eukprot:GHVU01201231.1.p3 GENE.GHVU01201231.1~~GHVU01201231.1.p3  ORF type:complete len:157 (+),score=28.68 GHVU01201231.1:129-599(+)
MPKFSPITDSEDDEDSKPEEHSNQSKPDKEDVEYVVGVVSELRAAFKGVPPPNNSFGFLPYFTWIPAEISTGHRVEREATFDLFKKEEGKEPNTQTETSEAVENEGASSCAVIAVDNASKRARIEALFCDDDLDLDKTLEQNLRHLRECGTEERTG